MGSKKNFVLDTNVVLHDYRCIYNFEENDVYLPMVLLEELDKFKKGTDQINFNARQFARELDEVVVAYMEMYPDVAFKDVHIFLDEIQLIKDWEYFVLRLYKSYCKNIYVCGSNATMLSKELSSALRGYPLEYETFPLSFNEYCRFIGVKTDSYLEQDIARLRNAFLEYNSVSSFPEIFRYNDS